ncbi:MAG: Rieske 2Fe-2S domain-containing protein [Chroococcidiopsidaceae cyanobacterium CP_BM_RX_35]|nr:Rieske 2Fe-2S domain-containing protein [Chroococcidiopsidaceae cyanobacterium CP_BM_RX_35]
MGSEFNFFQQWYPVSPVEDLDPKRPTPITLLGLQLVIWQSPTTARYCVFLDQCPHRLAPLSEGRVDEKTGHLMCSYHGWQFDSEGLCTHIPQVENQNLIVKNQQHLCAIALPCRQENDLLWVWPDVNSTDIANSKPLPLSPLIDASMGFVWSSFVRDMAYDWQTLVENVADPSHVPFAHHGVQGKREQAGPIAFDIVQSTKDLIEATTRNSSTKMTFEPPCHLEYAFKFGKDGQQGGLITYCLPVSPGKSRIVAQFPRNFAKAQQRLIPRWFDHINIRNQVLDGDMVLLHHQERILQQKQQSESWKTAYKLPTSADRFVIEFRNWFDKYCQGQLPWGKNSISSLSDESLTSCHEVLLDRYRQHTMHCSSCRQALKNFQRLQLILLCYFAVSVASVVVMPDAMRLNIGLPLTVLALIGLAIYTYIKYRVEPKFYFIDYMHADKS